MPAAARWRPPPRRPCTCVVEKILAEHEPLPRGLAGARRHRLPLRQPGQRPVRGIANEDALLAAWQAFTGDTTDFDELLYACKKLIIETSLYSPLNWLRTRCTGSRAATGPPPATSRRNRLRWALAEVAAAFPVYRTYLARRRARQRLDRRHIDWAIAAAARRLGKSAADACWNLRERLLAEGEAAPAAARRRASASWPAGSSSPRR